MKQRGELTVQSLFARKGGRIGTGEGAFRFDDNPRYRVQRPDWFIEVEPFKDIPLVVDYSVLRDIESAD